MLYLIAVILLNTLLFAIFKLFPRFGIDGLQAIVVNYFVCVITGSVFIGEFSIGQQSISEPWFPWSLGMGALFISLFNLMAWRTREDGMTTTTIANKLSMVIPVLFSIFLYGEQLGVLKIAGILLAFPAVYLTTKEPEGPLNSKNFLFPVLLFMGSGLLDTLVKYVEATFLKDSRAQAVYTIHLFAAAAVLGLMVVIYLRLRGKIKLQRKNMLAGIILGIPNYFSIYLLIRLLNSNFLQSSAAIPVNNIGIVLLSSLTAILFFREPINRQRALGLILSVAAILLIALSDIHGRPVSI